GIFFAGTNAYSISGAGVITLDTINRYDNSTRNAQLSTSAGSHSIANPMTWNKSVDATIATSSTLTVSGQVTAGAGVGLNKNGGGTLLMKNLRLASVNLNAGTTAIINDGTAIPSDPTLSRAGASRISTLNIAQAPLPQATLDINNAGVVFQ